MEDRGGTILMKRYEVGRMLGQGNFAKVYHARNLKTGQSVAIKVLNKDMVMKFGMAEQIKREISVMRLVRHPNIVHLYEVMASKTKICFVMEYVKGGELFDKVSLGRLKEDLARKYFQQLMDAIDLCHSRGVYHRDLKPENLLLDENGNLKVTDFGLSALTESRKSDGLLHTTCGTPAYVAPEVIRKKGYDGAKADIWSCGVILYVLLAGYLPFRDKNLIEMYRKIAKADFKCPQWFPVDAKRLLYRILDPNPITRVTIPRIMESRWFQKGYEHNALSHLPPLSPRWGGDDCSSDVEAAFAFTYSSSSSFSYSGEDDEEVVVPMKLYRFNAFDIIALSSGFDLSGLFEKDNSQKQHAMFITRMPPAVIASKLEEIGQMDNSFKVMRNNGVVRLEKRNTKGTSQLSIDTEIFQVTDSFHVVEINKVLGDSLEYTTFLEHHLKPFLDEIVLAWQGCHNHQ
ncbi:hypothetical protein HN51_002913 [Arachis hypogaea]|uniref:CBL-interacting serine/threonine-protein kinase 20-like isoform X1 n=1 Tax=Arachis hypogaea TaxID=3818 RepID=UPI000DECC9E2|nr:CBL-interacting serine/threonine-protein kinase 20-like [Arachis hypogaea]XP_025614055.1 CBL-interacting serine/threonine-protein kinase 20-like [Arachis hypogaea]